MTSHRSRVRVRAAQAIAIIVTVSAAAAIAVLGPGLWPAALVALAVDTWALLHPASHDDRPTDQDASWASFEQEFWAYAARQDRMRPRRTDRD
jgi:hypothetical protein